AAQPMSGNAIRAMATKRMMAEQRHCAIRPPAGDGAKAPRAAFAGWGATKNAGGGMAECAVCYVADVNFLLPSLVSATALRRAVSPARPHIFLFVVDGDATLPATLERFLAGDGIRVLRLTSRDFTGFDPGEFNKTHVPPATLGRFFMEAALPPACRRILY